MTAQLSAPEIAQTPYVDHVKRRVHEFARVRQIEQIVEITVGHADGLERLLVIAIGQKRLVQTPDLGLGARAAYELLIGQQEQTSHKIHVAMHGEKADARIEAPYLDGVVLGARYESAGFAKRQNAADTARMSAQCLQTLMRVQTPYFDGGVVRGADESPFAGLRLSRTPVDVIVMTVDCDTVVYGQMSLFFATCL